MIDHAKKGMTTVARPRARTRSREGFARQARTMRASAVCKHDSSAYGLNSFVIATAIGLIAKKKAPRSAAHGFVVMRRITSHRSGNCASPATYDKARVVCSQL